MSKASSLCRAWSYSTLKPGNLVIMDNLGSHTRALRSGRAIRAASAKLFFLPNHSPDLNPIGKPSPETAWTFG
jgi:transposase